VQALLLSRQQQVVERKGHAPEQAFAKKNTGKTACRSHLNAGARESINFCNFKAKLQGQGGRALSVETQTPIAL
jgi:hypothetical protein